MIKASIPQGTRDFGADVVLKRNYIFNTIQSVFELYGFQPLETPAMENLDTLMGKYGDEGDKLIFKILNNGLNNPSKKEILENEFQKILEGKSTTIITERALRYDLTIPFARYVAMNYGKLNFPFKRYQIQPVWRADRPQKGRYREFYQCDADVVGSASLINEIELANVYADVFKKLSIPVLIKINNRKILSALALLCGNIDMMDITIAIDKLDKIGLEKVKEELKQKNLSEEQIQFIETYLNISGSNEEKIEKAAVLLGNTEPGKKGLEEIKYLFQYLKNIPAEIDFTLARGLNYYTGTIFEVKAQNVQMGSIGGGGRYDDLTGLFGVPGIPGVGISFGVDRIYDVMEELKLFPEKDFTGSKALFFNMGERESTKAFELMQQLRASQIACEIYPEQTKLDKQFKYAERKNIPFVIIIGTKEIEAEICTIKNLKTGEQNVVSNSSLIEYLKNQNLQ